jgi:OPA family sugar phosphate sensor protein UhpC-like MFS transporter
MSQPSRHAVLRGFRRSSDAPHLVADPARLRRLQWQVFAAITLGYGFYYVCRLSLNVAKKPLLDSGAFDAAQLGVIGSALFFAYAGGRLLNGVLVDHANVRRFMATGLLLSALIHFALGSLPPFWLFVLLWGLNGWCQAMGAPASFVTIARWFPVRGRGTVYGVWSTSHNIGEAFTYLVTAALVSAAGAAWGLTAAGAIGLAAALGIALALRERPEVLGLQPPEPAGSLAPAADAARVRALQWQVLRMPALWTLALASGCFYVTRYAINSWGVFFLQEAKGYSAVQAASIISANALAGIVGTFCSGLVSDRLFGGGRHLPTFLFGLLYIGAIGWFVLGPASAASDTAAMVLFGVSMGALLAYLGGMIAIDLVPKAAVGMATGVVGVASYLGAAIQDLLSGHFIHASRVQVDGRPHYDFGVTGQLWIGAAVLSCVLALAVAAMGRRQGPAR